MEISWEPIALQLKMPFKIAHGTSVVRKNVLVRIRAGNAEGLGEAAPVVQHGESQQGVLDYLARLDLPGDDPFHLDEILGGLPAGSPAARAAVDVALHDLVGKLLGAPLYRLVGLTPSRAPRTCFTLGIGQVDEVVERAMQAAERFSILKLKLDADEALSLAVVRAVRRAVPATLMVDANCAWTLEQAQRLVPELTDQGVECIEQPLAEEDLAGMARLRQISPVPIFADEPVRTARDVPRLAGCCHGVNVKVQKAGGLREALRIVAAARAHDLQVMLGCMVETSLGITASAHLAPLFDWADLDGATNVANDPFIGVELAAGGRLVLPDGPGLGVTRREQAGNA